MGACWRKLYLPRQNANAVSAVAAVQISTHGRSMAVDLSTLSIGSRIMLVSRSGIRYEGILDTVDPDNSTVALAEVRSFGTEDRPLNEVYKYIVFDDSDIKNVWEWEMTQLPPPLCSGLPYYPAIVSISKEPNNPASCASAAAAYTGGASSDGVSASTALDGLSSLEEENPDVKKSSESIAEEKLGEIEDHESQNQADDTMFFTPYIGCKISLILKSDIRYNGILSIVDPENSTIALAGFRAFGTEPTGCPVPPRNEVYEHITFNTSDVTGIIFYGRGTPPCVGLPCSEAVFRILKILCPMVVNAFLVMFCTNSNLKPMFLACACGGQQGYETSEREAGHELAYKVVAIRLLNGPMKASQSKGVRRRHPKGSHYPASSTASKFSPSEKSPPPSSPFPNWGDHGRHLGSDGYVNHLLPLVESGDDLYSKVGDGSILCKLINLAVPETIDERAINKNDLNTHSKMENLTLALNSARAIGVNIVNIDADDLAKGNPHLVLDLLWQIIRIGLFSQIDLSHVPGLFRLLREDETVAYLQRLSPEQIVIRWVNYHLEQAGVGRRLNNFTSHVMDSEIYSYLLKQIAPAERGVTLEPMTISHDNVRRAELMLMEADKLNCRAFVTANDVSNGVYKLNLAFVANLFNTWPGLKPPGKDEVGDLEVIEETREERTYRNWMNSMGVDPHVNWLYSDLANGLVIFQLYDVIKPGLVDWKKVVRKFKKLGGIMDQIQNRNYAIELGKKLRFSLVGIQGKDIYDSNRTLLALVWQLMRAYTLSILANCTKSGDLATDREIIEWANKKLKGAGKQSVVSSFQDPKLSDARTITDLIDAIQPKIIDYSLVRDGGTDADKLTNAKYAVTTARKVGAKVYALPEDIVEVKPKMLLTVFACLMARDYQPNMREQSPAHVQPTVAASSPTSPLGSDHNKPSPVRQESPLAAAAEPNGHGRVETSPADTRRPAQADNGEEEDWE